MLRDVTFNDTAQWRGAAPRRIRTKTAASSLITAERKLTSELFVTADRQQEVAAQQCRLIVRMVDG